MRRSVQLMALVAVFLMSRHADAQNLSYAINSTPGYSTVATSNYVIAATPSYGVPSASSYAIASTPSYAMAPTPGYTMAPATATRVCIGYAMFPYGSSGDWVHYANAYDANCNWLYPTLYIGPYFGGSEYCPNCVTVQ